MVTGGIVPGNLSIFDGKGYHDWCVKMDAILGFQGVDEIVQKGCKEPLKSAEEKERKRSDCKARMLIHQYVSTNISQKKISKASTTKEAWDILSAGYGNSGKIKKVKIQSLRR